MAVDFKIAVSAENSAYIAWQTQLFCFSALTRLGKCPTIVVHRSAAPLLPEFEVLRSWGCPIVEAPQFRIHPTGEYPPRNELGSLFTLGCLPEFKDGYVLFCEPDMLFVNGLEYSGELSGEYYHYINYSEARVQRAAAKLGIKNSVEALNQTSKIGVPYLIHGSTISGIANRWLQVLDSFDELNWIDIMYAFGLALAAEGLAVKTTHSMAHNKEPLKPLRCSIIHYCYGDWRWDKRAFMDGKSPLRGPMPSFKGLSGTILGEILRQIRQVRAYERFPRAFKAAWRFAYGIPGHQPSPPQSRAASL